ncbi:hypothetical protein [Pseudomonas violetae]|uniref:Uncharacterized protein n=1 Tax=Pseudomonas violetae TaxID=2915813 RepID=A0ABT0F388_9PSED|nr:hypothetical protein [Pseudomonas violetae]MCK1792054.1 hypothetical protein [Pseudomonas violetae]
MKSFELKVVVFLIFSGIHTISHGAETTLCTTDEVMIASCHLNEKKNRILSFCSSADKKVVSYRFGLISKVELDAVFSSEAPLSRWVDTATYTVYLGFRRAKYSYVFGVPQETLGAKAFLDVAKDNKDLMSAECTDNSFGEKDLGSEAIHEVEDEFVRSNGFIFPPNDN